MKNNNAENNAVIGFTIQKIICDNYNLIPCKRATTTFESNYDEDYKDFFSTLEKRIFNEIGKKPTRCTTLQQENGVDIPYNFILEDGTSLSIRSNTVGDKVSPRKVGQAGFEKLNHYFSDIYGKEIKTQDDIKKFITTKIHKALPIFIENFLDADYIVWVYRDKEGFKYKIIKGSSLVDINFDKSSFSFTRNYEDWIESTTLKYNGISLAEIQVHKERSFKFRFNMKNFLNLIEERTITNETFGITAEKTICDLYNLEYPDNFNKRYSPETQLKLEKLILHIFKDMPSPIKHSGNDRGIRGGNSKCSYDFVLFGNKTLSLKTNLGKMVCPPEIGQPSSSTCYEYFGKYIEGNEMTKELFKKMVYEKIVNLIPMYIYHLFDSDYFLRVYQTNDLESPYGFDILPKEYGVSYFWNKESFSFSKKSIEEWNESNTVYYNGLTLGEFQVHNNRNCFKFRFNFENLLKILKEEK